MADTTTERAVTPASPADQTAIAPSSTEVPFAPDPLEEGEGGVMTLREHLIELRDRMVKAAIALGIGCVAGFFLAAPVLGYLAQQICPPGQADCRLVIIDPTEGMITTLKVALYLGVAISLPVVAFQFIRFMAPGLTRSEKRMLYSALPFVGLLFAAGSAFAVWLVIPAMLRFLSGFMNDIYRPDLRAAATLSLGLTVTLWMGLVFEMPLVMVLLARLGIVHWQRMLSWWRYAIVIILIVAAIITPTPDPVNMMIVAGPMMILYLLGVGLARLFSLRAARATTVAA